MAKEGWGFAARLNDSSGAQQVAKRQHLELVRRAADKVTVRVKLEPNVRILDVLGHESSLKGNTLEIPIGELGPGEVLPVVLQLGVKVSGTQVRPLELAHVELQYENALTERTRLQNITLKTEINPAKAKGSGALDAEASRHAARAILEAQPGASRGDRRGERSQGSPAAAG